MNHLYTPMRCERDCTLDRTRRRKGLSLLEVVLALAILALATAYLAQAMELATTNALKAQRLTQSEMVAESVMNQVIAGVIPSEPVTWTPYFNSTGQTNWLYQLQQVPTEVDGMIGLQVAVQMQDPNVGLVQNSYDLYANRWIIDPELMLDTPPEEEEDAGYGGESTGGGQSAGGSASSGASAGYGGGAFGAGGFGPGGPGGGDPNPDGPDRERER